MPFIASQNNKVWLAGLVSTVFVLAIALSLIPAHLTTANFGVDGGDLLAAVLTNGVPHPTGYPTYVLLGMLFQRIPIGSPYFRGALLSAFPAALAAGLLAGWLSLSAPDHILEKERTVGPGSLQVVIPGALVGFAWGISPLFLSQAVILEVYALHALFVVLGLVWIWMLLHKGNRATLILLAWLYGIGLGNHLTLLLLLPPLFYALWSAYRSGLPGLWVIAQGVVLLFGGLVYLYLPLSARNYPPVNWGNPQSWQGFWWVVSGQSYQNLFQITLPGLMDRLVTWFTLLRQQYGLLGLVIGAAGAVLAGTAKKRFSYILWWTFLSFSLLSLGYQTADSTVYLIPAFLVWAIWMGMALQAGWDATWRKIPWGKLLFGVLCIYLLARFPQVYHQVDPRSDTRLDQFARQALDDAPQNALFLTQSDPDTFSLWYYHFGLERRPDIVVFSVPLTVFQWYRETLVHTYPNLGFPPLAGYDNSDQWGKMIRVFNPQRVVCQSRVVTPLPLLLEFHCGN
jgi:hypothetical protein